MASAQMVSRLYASGMLMGHQLWETLLRLESGTSLSAPLHLSLAEIALLILRALLDWINLLSASDEI
jgi:hypothetical protein